MLKTFTLFSAIVLFTQSAWASIDSKIESPNSEPQPIQLTPYEAKYEATWKAGWFPITIEATRTLEKADNHWKISFEAYSSVADLSEISEFEIQQQQILPIKYRYKTSGFLSKKLRTIEFDREKNKTWLPYKDIWTDYQLTNDTQDHLSYREQIRLELMTGKNQLGYPVTYKSRLKNYQFEIIGESKMNTQNGPITVVEIRQIGLKKKETNQIWLAKDFEYIIVKLKAKKKGTTNTIKLKHAQIGQKTLSGL